MVRVVSFFFFFFSSRRWHTRCLSDWSSDVCSSDLLKCSGLYRTSRLWRPSFLRHQYLRSKVESQHNTDRWSFEIRLCYTERLLIVSVDLFAQNSNGLCCAEIRLYYEGIGDGENLGARVEMFGKARNT